MNSLWMSFSSRADDAKVRESAQTFTETWLATPLIEEVQRVIMELINDTLTHNPEGGELIISRRDDTILIEVLDRGTRHGPCVLNLAGRNAAPAAAALPFTRGIHRLSLGRVTWAEMSLHQQQTEPSDLSSEHVT
ncbi:hypothetical protein [Paractinoplanes rishiriensis]|uniref:Uncharacterized protein n=1 Tax=Paractinoplanes rishiriensis TaxID=1050105 RepID=A0A919MZE6_9ACTN|nr:hypothetical protein [Actinoplanes rishiriensis]GIF01140.1 hypothetical protein Ari01nite_86040 [Actinoplanes rishiriensis]